MISQQLFITLTIYLFSVATILYVANRYFSGTQFTGHVPHLSGKVAVITGGNKGIGREITKSLIKQGCRVIIGARDQKVSQEVIREIEKSNEKAEVEEYYLDLGDLQSVRQFVSRINSEKVDFLINNAGVMAIPERKLTKSGFETHYAINHLGHFYLTHLLYPKLQKSDFYRIVNASSLSHKRVLGFFKKTSLNLDDLNFDKEKYSPNLAYSRSKLYNVLFTHSLASLIPKEKGLVLSFHPGVVRTDISDHLTKGFLSYVLTLVYPLYCIFTKSPKEGAQTAFHCLFSDPHKLKNGFYYSDCHISRQSMLANENNWNKLWQLSERDCDIKFGQ